MKDSKFSKFFRFANSKEKRKVFMWVIKKVVKEQKKILN